MVASDLFTPREEATMSEEQKSASVSINVSKDHISKIALYVFYAINAIMLLWLVSIFFDGSIIQLLGVLGAWADIDIIVVSLYFFKKATDKPKQA